MTTQPYLALLLATLALNPTAGAQTDSDELRHFLPQQFADKLPRSLAAELMGPRKPLYLFVNPRSFAGAGAQPARDDGLSALPEHIQKILMKEELDAPKGRLLLHRKVAGFLQVCLGETAVRSIARDLRRDLDVNGNKAFVACVDLGFQVRAGEKTKLILSLRLMRLSLGEGRDAEGRAEIRRAELLFADRHMTTFDVEGATNDDAVLAAYRSALMRCLRDGIAPAFLGWRRMTEVSWLLACPGTITGSGLNPPSSQRSTTETPATEAKS